MERNKVDKIKDEVQTTKTRRDKHPDFEVKSMFNIRRKEEEKSKVQRTCAESIIKDRK